LGAELRAGGLSPPNPLTLSPDIGYTGLPWHYLCQVLTSRSLVKVAVTEEIAKVVGSNWSEGFLIKR